ncbi:hypothetical protein THASP1DRAFT_24405 [Thamnocephalis sphaerospora]|uniref:Nascent polypeptide-associated complex subunit alpha-like UBA domain-containing protein n=1 Tax=Thamnocephalis sphaerospora TaxID=78915 RepID=A0A4P9XQ97_9FUNG|nr:hypothetical protein THASP1DRAFT_24405 [Thamnocephalis sphaerospora]|eukprot:RKP07450.1 hypothetical protein THASP1DRAFT_24405 [Thamnocephalis sphaerospora]
MPKKTKPKKTQTASAASSAAASVTMTAVADGKSQPEHDAAQPDDEQQQQQKGHGAQASKDMGDMVRLLADKQSGELELSKTEKALKEIREEARNRKTERAKTATEASKQQQALTLNSDDVALVMAEFELTRPVAERHLREQQGDLGRTLRALVA